MRAELLRGMTSAMLNRADHGHSRAQHAAPGEHQRCDEYGYEPAAMFFRR